MYPLHFCRIVTGEKQISAWKEVSCRLVLNSLSFNYSSEI